MTNKCLSKTANKSLLFSIIVAVLLVASVIVSIVFGVNYNAKTDSARTLTVQMEQFFYENDLDELEDACKKEFKNQGLKVEYTYYDTRTASGTSRELVYVFANTEDVAKKVQTAKTNIAGTIATNTAEGGAWHGATSMYVTTGSEIVNVKVPTSYTVKATVVAVILSLFAGAYVAIRYGFKKGLVAFLAPIVGMALATSVILLTRIPFTNATFYAIAVGGLISLVFTVFTLAKMRSEQENKNGLDLVIDSVAVKEMYIFSMALGGALLLVGIIATWVVRWFALCALIALASALYAGLLFVPSVLAPMQLCDEKKASEKTASGYVGAKQKEEKEQKEQDE